MGQKEFNDRIREIVRQWVSVPSQTKLEENISRLWNDLEEGGLQYEF